MDPSSRWHDGGGAVGRSTVCVHKWIRAAGVSAAVVQWDDQACVSAGGSAGSIVQRKCAYFSCGKRIRGSDVRSSAEIRILRARVCVFQLNGACSKQRNAYFS